MNGSIVQISISRGGVPKLPVPEASAGPLGLDGDMCAHPQFHGGVNQALLLIGAEALDELREMGYSVYFGALGENITTKGLDRREMRLGQRYRLGGAMIELTRIRVPCDQITLYGGGIRKAVYDKDVKAGDASSPRWGLSGFYASVIQSGLIRTGDPVQLIEQTV